MYLMKWPEIVAVPLGDIVSILSVIPLNGGTALQELPSWLHDSSRHQRIKLSSQKKRGRTGATK